MEQELNREIDWIGLLAEVNDGEYRPEPISKETEDNIEALANMIPGLRHLDKAEASGADTLSVTGGKDEKELAEIPENAETDDLSVLDSEAAEKIAEKAAKAEKMTSAKRRRIQARDITRFALEQRDLPLSETITKSELKAFVTEMTRGSTEHMQMHLERITKTVWRVLLKHIPRYIKYSWENYRRSCKRAPGFLYSFDGEYGPVSIWLSPDLPNWLMPGEEQAIIDAELDSIKCEAMQRRIEVYYRLTDKKRKDEVRIALTFARRHIKTYMDLLKENPFWWEVMYSIKTGNKIADYAKTLQ